MDENFDSFTREIEVAIRTRERYLEEKKNQAIQKGLKKEHFDEKEY